MAARKRTRSKGVTGQVTMRDPSGLQPHPRNSRTHSTYQIAQVAESITRFGFNNPVLVRGDVIVAGHARVEAAKTLKMAGVPTLDLSHMTEAEVRAYLIADNKHAENSGWDLDVLRSEMTDLGEMGFDAHMMGFDDAAMGQLMATGDEVDPDAEWKGMPEFSQNDTTAFRTITVHLKDQAAVDAFAKATGHNLTPSTKFIWYPEIEIETYADKRYVSGAHNGVGVKQIEVKGVKAMVREGTSDEFVVNEVIKGNTYRKLNLRSEDVVLDAGMNIGMFTTQALQKGATVHAFEPDADNFKLAKQNVELNGFTDGFSLYNKALTGTNDKTRSFSLNQRKNKGAHSLVPKKGRDTVQVDCENINSAIKRIRPTVVKMDIEGGEYECLLAMKDFKGIREWIMEFHHAHLDDIESRSKYKKVIEILKKHFKNVDYREETKKAWVTLVYCSNGH